MRIKHRDVETRGNAPSIQASGILLLFFGSQEQLRPLTHHTLCQFFVLRLNIESQSSPGEAGNCEDIKDSEVVFAWHLCPPCSQLTASQTQENPSLWMEVTWFWWSLK
jgi:hypothetical protein